MSILKQISAALSGRQDIILAVFVVSIIFMLVIPLPTVIVDVLIAFNIAISVILLMVAIYLAAPLDFAAFPAVLLITTLFRLALSISTTRLILLQADAGEIIQTFGEFVVGGNLVVGLVIFLILTIVQFIVITKGAERVAEVSARFSLDAMPGKQLSIDADVRAGSLTLEEAKIQRNNIQRESKLYGSMDGAMKFVKGDAIASLIIVFVNMLGGLAIGSIQRGLSFSEAIQVYSILTIGDGLIGQIPALFISITAGIIVTRVTDDTHKTNLGKDIGEQIGRQPKALLVAGAMLCVFALIPGFPWVVFLTLAVVLTAPALAVMYTEHKDKKKALTQPQQQLTTPSEATANEIDSELAAKPAKEIFYPTVPLLLELPSQALEIETFANIQTTINGLRISLYYRLGIALPEVAVRVNSALEEQKYRLFVGEIPTSEGRLNGSMLFAFTSAETLETFAIPFEKGPDFIPRQETLWIEQKYSDRLVEANIPFKKPINAVAYHAEAIVARYIGQFVGIQEVRHMLAHMEQGFPDLVKEAQRVLPIQTLTEIMRRLVQEYVSVRDLRAVLSAIIEWGSKEKDPVMLVEQIRSSLSRQISFQYSGGFNLLPAFLLTNEVEDKIRNAIRQTSVASYISLEPEAAKRIVSSIRERTMQEGESETSPVLVTALDIRRYVRRLIEAELPELPVLSYQEIVPEIALQPLGRIGM